MCAWGCIRAPEYSGGGCFRTVVVVLAALSTATGWWWRRPWWSRRSGTARRFDGLGGLRFPRQRRNADAGRTRAPPCQHANAHQFVAGESTVDHRGIRSSHPLFERQTRPTDGRRGPRWRRWSGRQPTGLSPWYVTVFCFVFLAFLHDIQSFLEFIFVCLGHQADTLPVELRRAVADKTIRWSCNRGYLAF